MTTGRPTRRERIELRATSEEKELLVAAAAESGSDVTTFVLGQALPAAQEVVDRARRLVVSERDYALILRLLEDPPEPTPALVAAFKRRRERLARD